MAVTIRTITLGVADPHPLTSAAIVRAANFLRQAQTAAEEQGYIVQTTRIATRPLLEDTADWPPAKVIAYARNLQAICEDAGIGLLSLGPAPADDPAFPLDRLRILLAVLAANPALNASVQLATEARGVNYGAALTVAQIMRRLAEVSKETGGDANFRFAALAMCEPGGPFFPQAYHRAPEWSASVGLQSAGLVGQAITSAVNSRGDPAQRLAALPQIGSAVSQALAHAAEPVVTLIRAQATSAGFAFGGIDLSPAPMGNESITSAFEATGIGDFGSAGTLALAATLTGAIKAAAFATPTGEPLPTCGYCGLMLPVLEDAPLGQRCAEGRVTIHDLLTYSAVCGTGLDTIPLPGEAEPERVATLLADVATLAHRLRKPLSARLFLIPGGQAGEMTRFDSPYLTNTRILGL